MKGYIMNYSPNRVGTAGCIDIGASAITALGTITYTAIGSALVPYFDAPNTGQSGEHFQSINASSTISIPAFSGVSLGVCLSHLAPYTSDPEKIALDLMLNSIIADADSIAGILTPIVWCGYLDGISPTTGWSVNNTITDYHVLPFTSQSAGHITCREQIVIGDMVSSTADIDKYPVIGLSYFNSTVATVTIDQFWSSISARYCSGTLLVQEPEDRTTY